MRNGFPDIQWTLEEMIAEGDRVAARFTMRGTHKGPFFGVPPTGKSIEVQAMNFYCLSGGQFSKSVASPTCLDSCSRSAHYPPIKVKSGPIGRVTGQVEIRRISLCGSCPGNSLSGIENSINQSTLSSTQMPPDRSSMFTTNLS